MPLALKRKPRRHHILDAAENIWFGKQIVSTRARAMQVRYPELKGRTFVPKADGFDNATDTFDYVQYDGVAVAKIIASYADDLPRADVTGRTFFGTVKSLGNAYGYSLQEIRKARRNGVPLSQQKANVARRAHEELVDKLLAHGDAANSLLGLLNQPNALAMSAPDGAGAGTDSAWTAKTPDEILADMHAGPQAMVDATNQLEQPDTLLLPPSRYGLVATRYLDKTAGQTVLQAFLATSPYITNVDQWSPLETAGAGGTKRAVFYRRSPDALEAVIPQEFEQLDEQARGLEVVVPCHSRCGGVIVYLPLSMLYLDGI